MNKVRYVDFKMVEKFYKKTTSMSDVTNGRINENKIIDLLERPQWKLFGVEKYDTIYKKAACLLEGFCRGHAFTDGNKRMAIMITRQFLKINNLYFVISIDSMAFMNKFAQDESSTEEGIDRFINEVVKWIEERSGTFDKMHKLEAKYVLEPIIELLEFLNGNGNKTVNSILAEWFDKKEYSGEDIQTTMNYLIEIFKIVYKELNES